MSVSSRVSPNVPLSEPSIIAGSVLPIQRAEELLATLPGVISARIVASGSGSVEEIHILTTDEVPPKQTVRNVESALIAHLGMRVSHKKISVATSHEMPHPQKPAEGVTPLRATADAPRAQAPQAQPIPSHQTTPPASHSAVPAAPAATMSQTTPTNGMPIVSFDAVASQKRRLYFENVEIRRSRAKGVTLRVTLRKGDLLFAGEAEGTENERLRTELAARATLSAISEAEGDARVLGLEGCTSVEAFDRQFVFVGVTTRMGRESALLTGSAEIKESPETASVLATLDATNRWIDYAK